MSINRRDRGATRQLEQPTGAYAVRRSRIITKFFVTVDIPEFYETCREDFVANFEDLSSFAAAYEKSETERVSGHLHVYLEFINGYTLSDFREIVSCYVFENNFDLQPCKSKRNVLIYLSKEDPFLYTNIKRSAFSFYYRLYWWAVHTKIFSFTDPFVVKNHNRYQFIRKFHMEMQSKLLPEFTAFSKIGGTYLGWPMEVAIWWNSWLDGYTHKKKQLYLWGGSNVGKTTFIERVLTRRNLHYVFYPGVGKFFMMGLNMNVHKVIVFEEFDYKYHCPSMLKRLLEGKPYSYPVKCEPDKLIVWRRPIIFISNFNTIDDDALRNRLLFVSAEIPYWENETGPVPKEEVDAMETEAANIIEISDEEAEIQGAVEALQADIQEAYNDASHHRDSALWSNV